MIAAPQATQEHEGGGDVGDSDGMQTGNARGQGVPPPPGQPLSSAVAVATIPITAADFAEEALFDVLVISD